MIQLRRSQERGYFNHGWLRTYHSFSFADYFDRRFMGFRSLRVINEDFVEGGQGFGTHPHRDMEIVTYILDGALEHKDSMGNGSVIKVGDVQYMSAASGVTHSEFNHLNDQATHLMQIWILPEQRGGEPRYDQKNFPRNDKLNKLCKIVSQNGEGGSIAIRQNATIYASILESGKHIDLITKPENGYWLQVLKGEIKVGSEILKQGDAMSFEEQNQMTVHGLSNESEFLLFDLK